jgi:hypothetical protein
MAEASTTRLQSWIDRMRAGEKDARDELLNHACERLRRLTRKMLQDFARVRHWEDTLAEGDLDGGVPSMQHQRV